jgi:hypothetical protein
MTAKELKHLDNQIIKLIEQMPSDDDNSVIYLRLKDSDEHHTMATKTSMENAVLTLMASAVENDDFGQILILSAEAYKRHLSFQKQITVN